MDAIDLLDDGARGCDGCRWRGRCDQYRYLLRREIQKATARRFDFGMRIRDQCARLAAILICVVGGFVVAIAGGLIGWSIHYAIAYVAH